MTTKSPDPTADAVERGAHAIMDEMERINAEKAAFSGPVPRDRYLPDMRRYARAVIAALTSPTQPSVEPVTKDDEWRYSHDEIESACGGKTAMDVRDKVKARRGRIDELRRRSAPLPLPEKQ